MTMDVVLMKEWHPVAFSKEVREKPVGAVVMGERIVVFRTSQGIKALKDLCIHRGAALSLGKKQGDEIVCPYHGWRYDGAGQCTHIPQQCENRAIPAKARAVPYACTEAYGIVWVCLNGDGNADASLPSYPEYDDANYRTVHCGPYYLEASVPRVVENFLDVGHLAFLHEGFLGDPAYPEISDYKVRKLEDRIVSDEIAVYQPDPDGRGMPVTTRYIYEILKPTVARLKKTDPASREVFSMLFAVLPDGPLSSKAFINVSRNYGFDIPDEQFERFQQLILNQDSSVVESQRPELLPLDLQAELHLPADRMSIAYRKWLGELNVTWGTA
ncbi:aromatic ring-hydroxylating dioxygenase subunit alpha [Paenibacillus alkalitolerans]|uniref:aromatic ring-hydroxylating dioxygenase subunit alpha n=1 Tax=Paenibacillus alkalitolerans TaxID=2799335 RepID=UPI0018F2F536|nr:aromatic ring-hydroxylating dioxygenase subunit alpha [Paenibacillus alkalitolerans]